MNKKALLMILDGWGIGDNSRADVIASTPTPYWDYLMTTYPHSQLQASGENVGLPDGQMGNSEVGHLNIGAGRVVYQDLVKINKACRENTIMENPEIVAYGSRFLRGMYLCSRQQQEYSLYGLDIEWWCTQLARSPLQVVRHLSRVWYRQHIHTLLYGWSRHRSQER